MGESIEELEPELELEPLFDYTRVQPVSFISLDEDDSDSEKVISPKKRMKKTELKKSELVSDNVVKPAVTVVDIDEEDWLPPPPKTSKGDRKIELENSTIKELRLKKQELASFAQSAEEVLREVEESARQQLASSGQSSLDSEAEQSSKPSVDRAKIVITIQDNKGPKQYRIYTDEKLERIFKLYAGKEKHDIGSLVFTFDGDKVSHTASPGGLDMEDNDIIEVHTKST